MTFDEWWRDGYPYEDCSNVAKMAYDSRNAEVDNLAALGRNYLSRANAAEFECDQLRKQVTLLRDATKKALNGILFHHDPEQVRVGIDAANEALAATADLEGLILCHAEPVGIGSKARGIGEDYQPLYRAWEPK